MIEDFILLPYTILGWTFKWLFSIGMWFVLAMCIHWFWTEKIRYNVNWKLPFKIRWPFYRD